MIYVTADLHGCALEQLKGLLEKADFSGKDFCFVLGDVIDRGPDGVAILKWMMLQPNIELILGNHEAMLLSCSFLFDTITEESIDNLSEEKMGVFTNWVENGAEPTLKALSETDPESVLAILEYLEEAPLFESVSVNGQDYLLTHSGIANFDKSKKIDQYSADELLWNRPNLTDQYFDDIITVFGHTPTYFYGDQYDGKAIKTKTWIDVDTGAAYGRSPMLLRLDDGKEFYIDE